mmetsp:Transcript_63319/g.131728  ORF Transcript_63319/g.131728 Transcript_63319/m.131728 type:complete len:239 (-) Transcript_63319:177-893(-)|eukprot:CAMPEP_0181292354 /NCGR_PEP_ID=MMETSP1101-20121128/2462_1 /TAXON_ID=46948 /ORGANISM="Rhodomonas abbreviata, Strain Caron Lab Isolate" /LENGTH=238 /DNA_ID=CAMNT_0023396819 /DNA_START=52 /DNA_END=768 /DNA_ORIENTATION=+
MVRVKAFPVSGVLIALFLSTASAFLPCRFPLQQSSSSSALSTPRSRHQAAFRCAQTALGAQSSKSELVDLILTSSKGTEVSTEVSGRVDELVNILAGEGKAFDRSTVDGDWALIYEKNSDGSPALQKFTQNFETVGGSFANFDVSKGEFYNIADVFGGNGQIRATVSFGETDPTRISCDIVDASLKVLSLPAIPLPLRVKGGWLDFIYLDEDLRITRGNRGGVFMHIRPQLLKEKLQN